MNTDPHPGGPLDTHQKAFQINLDAHRYGTIAEIGAGQEVARAFFHVGGAAGTVAKTISAYDMTFSDAIYGPCERYVSRQRLQTMLDYEFALLLERLNQQRGSGSLFFVFADTVAARSYSRQHDAHGWMGIKFQTEPMGSPSQILLHVRMWDKENVQQQEAVGALGVNLIHGAFYLHQAPGQLISSLLDNLSPERIEVDLVKFSGPAFREVDNRLMSLQLLHHQLGNTALFMPGGEVAQPGEVLYNKPILVERGSFRPVNLLHLDMLQGAREKFAGEAGVEGQEVEILMEITMRNLVSPSSGTIDHQDFLARVDLLGALGLNVMISNYSRFYRMAAYLAGLTRQRIGFAVGTPTLKEIFDARYYGDLEGGILESFGRLFKNAVRLYIHPCRETTGPLVTVKNLEVAPNLRHLYAFLLENRHLEFIDHYDESLLPIRSRDLLERIQSGKPGWEAMVPPKVAGLIKERGYFGSAKQPAS
jgi:hypothetical protein